MWPENSEKARQLLSTYMVKVVGCLGISFDASPCDPVSVVNALLSGGMSDDDVRTALDYWWSQVDEHGVRNFEKREALIARLAIYLLSSSQQESRDLGDQLSWFMEVLGFLGMDVGKSIDIMEKYFDFRKN